MKKLFIGMALSLGAVWLGGFFMHMFAQESSWVYMTAGVSVVIVWYILVVGMVEA